MSNDHGSLDQKILNLAAAGHSPDEISRRIGHVMSGAKVAVYIQRLVESPDDYLSMPQQMRLNLKMMRETLAELRTRYLDIEHAKVSLAYMKEIGATLERLQKTNDHDLETYDANVGRAMAHAYDLAMAHIGGRLVGREEPLSLGEWAALKREAMEVAQGEVAKKQLAE